jgi:hypothetical protein
MSSEKEMSVKTWTSVTAVANKSRSNDDLATGIYVLFMIL